MCREQFHRYLIRTKNLRLQIVVFDNDKLCVVCERSFIGTRTRTFVNTAGKRGRGLWDAPLVIGAFELEIIDPSERLQHVFGNAFLCLLCINLCSDWVIPQTFLKK
jgi:hypothetical protein